jgi:uncharacterized protein YndB with AHSA1/START domain
MPALETALTTENILLTQTRIIRAPRAKVYEAWTNPSIMKQWFGNAAMVCTAATLDVRTGGSYRIEAVRTDAPAIAGMSAEDPCAGRNFSAAVGTYTKVVPNELLQFTWTPAWNPEEQSLVTVTLKEAPGGTEITVLHEKFANEASRDAHNSGWSYALGSIDRILTA